MDVVDDNERSINQASTSEESYVKLSLNAQVRKLVP